MENTTTNPTPRLSADVLTVLADAVTADHDDTLSSVEVADALAAIAALRAGAQITPVDRPATRTVMPADLTGGETLVGDSGAQIVITGEASRSSAMYGMVRAEVEIGTLYLDEDIPVEILDDTPSASDRGDRTVWRLCVADIETVAGRVLTDAEIAEVARALDFSIGGIEEAIDAVVGLVAGDE